MANENKNEMKNENFRLVVGFSYQENYGAHDWDGKGECPQYWKSKGGIDVIVDLGAAWCIRSSAQDTVDKIVSEQQLTNDEYSTMFYADHKVIAPGKMTPQEAADAEWEAYMKS